MKIFDSTNRITTLNSKYVSSSRWLDKNISKELAETKLDLIQSIKEFVRHVIFRVGLYSYLDIIRSMRGLRVRTVLNGTIDARFQEIYERRLWVMADGQESLSGTGSSRIATSGLVDAIITGMDTLNCKSLLDIGCGDWNWFQYENFGFDYIGVDVVKSVISNNQKFAGPRVRFKVLNAISDPLPIVDMGLCREVLFHLSFSDARKMLLNVAAHATYVCATTDHGLLFNSDIPSGDFRTLNLLKRPFKLPNPQALIPDFFVRRGRFLGVWQASSILDCLNSAAKS